MRPRQTASWQPDDTVAALHAAQRSAQSGGSCWELCEILDWILGLLSNIIYSLVSICYGTISIIYKDSLFILS